MALLDVKRHLSTKLSTAIVDSHKSAYRSRVYVTIWRFTLIDNGDRRGSTCIYATWQVAVLRPCDERIFYVNKAEKTFAFLRNRGTYSQLRDGAQQYEFIYENREIENL